MAKKPKAGGAKVQIKKTKAPEKTQAERFIEAARSIGVDESGTEFERAIKTLIPPKRLNKL
jgi:hypothetical protein